MNMPVKREPAGKASPLVTLKSTHGPNAFPVVIFTWKGLFRSCQSVSRLLL